MPTKGKLPNATELEGQILAALRELGGPAHFVKINERVKTNLEPFVYLSEFKKETQDFYETSFSSKCARARGSLRKDEILAWGNKKGYWQLNRPSDLEPPKLDPKDIKRSRANNVTKFAAEAIERLEEKGVPSDAIKAVRELWQEFLMAYPQAYPSNKENRQIEAKAIDFIRKKEPEKIWLSPEDPNNPGFDLYRADRNGKTIAWCEVKSLSKSLNRVSLSHTEFDFARKKGKRYWLYIVENVERGDPALIRINDPARKAEGFTYGRAWRDVAEK